ncbi:MerR family transcriptional regulator [Oceanobacillus massiliensis]|uniref:MerR family transcriptional regulator n=1 Tax=Oceanobacillus massiliensis TaxID=1465765 RepID=UPI00028989A6|nr:MerR family transcriptional regulator [Oceanobacillus massiliensis]
MKINDYQRSYSLSDIARQLGRPRTTVQEWRNQFKQYLPTVSGTEGRTLRYDEKAVALFELIARMKDANEPPSMIEKALTGSVEITTIEYEDIEENRSPMFAQMYEGFKQLAAALDKQQEHNELILRELQELRQVQAADKQTHMDNHRELMERFEQQSYIDESLKQRDAKLLETMHELQKKKDKENRQGRLIPKLFSK